MSSSLKPKRQTTLQRPPTPSHHSRPQSQTPGQGRQSKAKQSLCTHGQSKIHTQTDHEKRLNKKYEIQILRTPWNFFYTKTITIQTYKNEVSNIPAFF